MAGETRIVPFDSTSPSAAGDEIPFAGETSSAAIEPNDWPDEEPAKAGHTWLLPVLAAIAVLAWTAFFAWAMRDRIVAGAPAGQWPGQGPEQWIALLRDWAMPVILLALGALILLRNSRREALRFGAAANILSDESARLETRLSAVNRELSLAREFIAAQSRDLETLGRLAADRLSHEADRMQGLIRDNHVRIEAIGTVSEAALDNMEKLRGQLPVIASSAKDVTNAIGNAGRIAQTQLDEMVSGFGRLNDFGQASEHRVQSLRSLIDQTITEFTRQTEQFGTIAATHFDRLHEQGAEFRTQLDQHEAEALAMARMRAMAMAEEFEETRQTLDRHEAEALTSVRARLSSLRDEGAALSRALRESEARAFEEWQAGVTRMKEELQSTLVVLAETETEAAEASQARLIAIGAELERLEYRATERAGRFAADLGQRQAEAVAAHEATIGRLQAHLAAIDREIAESYARHEAQSAAMTAQAEAIVLRLGTFEQRIAEIAAHGSSAEATIGAGLQALTDHLAASRTALAGTDAEIAALTDASVRLLELIQASVTHSGEELPAALVRGHARLADLEKRMAALHETANETDTRGAHLASTLDIADGNLRQTYADLAALQTGIEEAGSAHNQTLAALRRELEAIAQQSAQLSDNTRTQLAGALNELSGSVHAALSGFGDRGAAAVSALVRQIGEESSTAIERAMRASVEENSGRLEHAATHAAAISREAALHLRDQLAEVNELAGNLESRVAHARQRAEEQIDNGFARRIALITESLNSNAIDIARALSTDVSDTAWAAYLRGDRSIFTRRAVSLIDNAKARAIAQIYERDHEFHEHVSCYIRDFEAMLRQILSARDGQVLGVTLLSSDMGKLYVVLAQAIQRLRG
jgi:hypothetical protein